MLAAALRIHRRSHASGVAACALFVVAAAHATTARAAEHTLMPSPQTIDFITKRFPHLTREEAYMIASVAVDYHVTQVVDGTKGIHGMIPKSIFTAQR